MLTFAKSCEEDNTIKKLSITMEYYSAIKKNKMLPFATIWMDLEGIILSKISPMTNTLRAIIYKTCGI